MEAPSNPPLLSVTRTSPAPFSIDSDVSIQEQERVFISDMCKFEIGNSSTTALYSRSLQQYVAANVEKLTQTALSSFSSGHTLAIDQTKSYVRYLSFDIDCICRKKGMENRCITYSDIDEIIQELKSILATDLKMQMCSKKANFAQSVWNLNCGYHIYTNIAVTIPSHHFIHQRLVTAMIGKPSYLRAIIELPDMMPLPYSAKVLNKKYTPYGWKDATMTRYAPLPNEEVYEYIICVPKGIKNNILGSVSSQFGPMDLVANPFPTVDVVAIANNIVEYNLNSTYKNRQLDIYLSNLTKYNIEKNLVNHPEPEQTLIDFKGCKHVKHIRDFMLITVQVLNAANYEAAREASTQAPVYLDDSEIFTGIQSATINLTLSFPQVVSNEDGNIESTLINCSYFLRAALDVEFGLNMQHYMVALHKYIKLKCPNGAVTIEDFREILRRLLSNYMGRPTVYNFVTYFSSAITDAYTDSYDYILSYFTYTRAIHLTPDRSVKDVFNNFLNIAGGSDEPTILSPGSKPHMAFMTQIIDFVLRTRYMLICKQSDRMYVFEDYRYVSIPTLEARYYPSNMLMWLGKNNISTLSDLLRVRCEEINLTNCPFMYATEYGVFNAITCQYVSNSPMLQFTMHRGPIYMNHEYEMAIPWDRLNSDLYEQLKMSENIIQNLKYVCDTLYIKGFFLPALVNMGQIYDIESMHISSLLNRIVKSMNIDFSPLFSIVEQYAISPTMIVLINDIISSTGTPSSFESYSKLCMHALRGRKEKLDWLHNFPPRNVTIKEIPDNSTHMEKLTNLLVDNEEYDISEDMVFLASLIAMAVFKCRSFETFCDAYLDYMPQVRLVNSILPECNTDLNSKDHGVYLVKIIDEIVQYLKPENVGQFDNYRQLLIELTSVMTSVNFDLTSTFSVFDTLSASFVMYNFHKKIFIYYGMGDVGKSLLCDKLYDYIKHSVRRMRNLDKAISRSNVTTEAFVAIQHEMSKLNSSDIKAISGNDKEDVSRFYTQKLERTSNQSLIYGATNVNIQFNTDIDRTTVDRIYVVEFKGRMPAVVGTNMFTMFMENNYMRGMLPNNDLKHISLGMLSLANYMQHRDANYYPALRETEETFNYRSKTYFLNNNLYRTISRAQFVYHSGFYTPVKEFKMAINNYLTTTESYEGLASVVSAAINNGVGGPPQKKRQRTENYTISTFCTQFNQQYNINLLMSDNESAIVENFQMASLIEHVKMNMKVEIQSSNFITRENLKNQLSVYKNNSDYSNASRYFERENMHRYDKIMDRYSGIRFVNEATSYVHVGLSYASTPDESDNAEVDDNSLSTVFSLMTRKK